MMNASARLMCLRPIGVGVVCLITPMVGAAQSGAAGGGLVRPEVASRLRAIGSASAVDRYVTPIDRAAPVSVAAHSDGRRRNIRLTQFEFPGGSFATPPPIEATPIQPPPSQMPAGQMPAGQMPVGQMPGGGLPGLGSTNPGAPVTGLPATGPSAAGSSVTGRTNLPRRLPAGPNAGRLAPNVADDYAPMIQPTLDPINLGNFATANNSPFVTPASGYTAAMGYGVTPASAAVCDTPGLTQNPAVVQTPILTTPPTVGVPVLGPMTPPPGFGATPQGFGSAAPAGALFSLGQNQNPVEVGPGLIGQPKAYVPGQPVRNWLRYLTP